MTNVAFKQRKGGDRAQGGRPSKAPNRFLRRMAPAVAALAISVAGCSEDSQVLPTIPGTTANGGSGGAGGVAGGSTTTSGSGGGGGSTTSGGAGGVAGSGGTQTGGTGGGGGVAGAGGVAGSGGTQTGGTGGTAGSGGAGGVAGAGGSPGTVCPGVSTDSLVGVSVTHGDYIIVGGYRFTNKGETTQGQDLGISVDIHCDATAALVEGSVFCKEGGPAAVVSVPADGKKITIFDVGHNPLFAVMTVLVENL